MKIFVYVLYIYIYIYIYVYILIYMYIYNCYIHNEHACSASALLQGCISLGRCVHLLYVVSREIQFCRIDLRVLLRQSLYLSHFVSWGAVSSCSVYHNLWICRDTTEALDLSYFSSRSSSLSYFVIRACEFIISYMPENECIRVCVLYIYIYIHVGPTQWRLGLNLNRLCIIEDAKWLRFKCRHQQSKPTLWK